MSFASAMGKRRGTWCHQQEWKIWSGEKGEWVLGVPTVSCRRKNWARRGSRSQLPGHVAERSSDYVEGEVIASWKSGHQPWETTLGLERETLGHQRIAPCAVAIDYLKDWKSVPSFIVGNLTPQCSDVRGGASGRWGGHEDGDLMHWISALIKKEMPGGFPSGPAVEMPPFHFRVVNLIPDPRNSACC